jgi:hypothetical protein
MPYYIRKLPNKNLYRVINTENPGKKYSRDGQPKSLAIKQMNILAASEDKPVETRIPKKRKVVPKRARTEKGSDAAIEWGKRMKEIRQSRKLLKESPSSDQLS